MLLFCLSKGGNNVASYQLLFNCDEKTAALQIACDFGLITKEEFEKLSDVEYVKTEAKYDFQKYVKPKPVYQDEVLKVRTDTYEFMRDYFGLTDEDRELLEKKRALEPERIAADYFPSTQSQIQIRLRIFVRRLQNGSQNMHPK